MQRNARSLLATATAILAVSASATATAHVARDPHPTPASGVSVWRVDTRPCHHTLRVDPRTGAPVGRPTTYGAACIVA